MLMKHSKALALFLAIVLVFSMPCISAMALSNVDYNTSPASAEVQTGDTATINLYLSYPEKFEGIQFAVNYSDNLKISPDMYWEGSDKDGNLLKMMPNMLIGSTMINLKPSSSPNMILANNMNVQLGNLFTEETLLFTCTFDVIADGEATVDWEIQEMYNMDDTSCDPAQVVTRSELIVHHN